MHIDARKLENDTLIEGDVCIIGAGAAGISMALDWMNTPYKVILLEGGGFDYDDRVQDLRAPRPDRSITRIEQAPNPDSRVTIGPEKDELGMPRVNLHWQLLPLDKRSIRRFYQILGQQMGLANIARVKLMDFLQDEKDDTSWPEDTNGGWHHMGVTRMGNDPRKSVVDANCQVHGISNLYVAGSGCYATSGAPNPTFTLVALSPRLSDYVMGKVKG